MGHDATGRPTGGSGGRGFGPVLRHCALVADGAGTWHAPGAILHDGCEIIAVGAPESIGRAGDAVFVPDPEGVVIPGLVNAHAHLDLSHLGADVPCGDSFAAWIDGVRAGRASEPVDVAASTRLGIDLALAGGTVAVGDIAGAGSFVPVEVLDASSLAGVSFVELFGFGAGAAESVRRICSADLPRTMRIATGWQPHAPYSCAPAVYAAAADSGRPVSTHLAETMDELEFVRQRTGSLATFLKRLGIDPGPPPGVAHPVLQLAESLAEAPWLIAHLNYLDGLAEEALAALASAGATVAYCPRAHAAFGHVGHPYRELAAAGIAVALGTDGLLCTDRADRLSVLDEMRLLFRRDGVAPRTLLAMATVAGARALGIEPAGVTLVSGATLGLLRLEAGPGPCGKAFERVLESDAAPAWLAPPASVPAGR